MLRAGVMRAFATAAPRPAAGKRPHKKGLSRFAKAGLPLVLFVVGGFLGLTQVWIDTRRWLWVESWGLTDGRLTLGGMAEQFMGGKYEARDLAIKSQSTRAFDLDEEHKVRRLAVVALTRTRSSVYLQPSRLG